MLVPERGGSDGLLGLESSLPFRMRRFRRQVEDVEEDLQVADVDDSAAVVCGSVVSDLRGCNDVAGREEGHSVRMRFLFRDGMRDCVVAEVDFRSISYR